MGIPPARSMSRSSMLSAPAHILAITVSSFGAGFAAPDLIRGVVIDTFPAMLSARPVCSASPSSGTSPASDTRLSSSNRAEPAVNLCETRTESASLPLGRSVRRNTILPAQKALSSFTRRHSTSSVCGSRLSERFGTWSCGAGQPTRHRHDHGNVDHGLVVLGQGLVVTDAAAAFADPGKRALYDPPSGQHVEPGQVVAAFDDFHDQVQHGAGPGREAACVAGVGPDEADGAEPGPQRAQQAQPGVAVLDGGNGDHDGQ